MARRLVLVGVGRAATLRQLLPQACDPTRRCDGRIDVAIGWWVRRVQASTSVGIAGPPRERGAADGRADNRH